MMLFKDVFSRNVQSNLVGRWWGELRESGWEALCIEIMRAFRSSEGQQRKDSPSPL